MALEIQSISGEEWDQSVEFAYILTKAKDLLNKSADVEYLKDILKLFCHPPTSQQNIDIEFKFYEHCRTPLEFIVALVQPGYINFDFLRQIVWKVGDEQSKTHQVNQCFILFNCQMKVAKFYTSKMFTISKRKNMYM